MEELFADFILVNETKCYLYPACASLDVAVGQVGQVSGLYFYKPNGNTDKKLVSRMDYESLELIRKVTQSLKRKESQGFNILVHLSAKVVIPLCTFVLKQRDKVMVI
ncbi:MAG: hypothetical protein MZV63_44795 [Marinilabiliales bacterium]|nr:hypothetical protein [Marinilabiliales bacterium]